VNDKKIEGDLRLRDESDREGMRIVIETEEGRHPRDRAEPALQADADAGFVRHHHVGRSSMAAEALDPQRRPQGVHRAPQGRRRSPTVFELRKAEERLAYPRRAEDRAGPLDAVIALHPQSREPRRRQGGIGAAVPTVGDPGQAFSTCGLQRLTGLEREKILAEHAETLRQIARYKEILADERRSTRSLSPSCTRSESHADERRTQIVDETTEISIGGHDRRRGYGGSPSRTRATSKRNAPPSIARNAAAGRGKLGATTKEEDFVEHLFVASTHSHLLFFTTSGKVYWIKVHELRRQAVRPRQGDRQSVEPGQGREDLRLLAGAGVPRKDATSSSRPQNGR